MLLLFAFGQKPTMKFCIYALWREVLGTPGLPCCAGNLSVWRPDSLHLGPSSFQEKAERIWQWQHCGVNGFVVRGVVTWAKLCTAKVSRERERGGRKWGKWEVVLLKPNVSFRASERQSNRYTVYETVDWPRLVLFLKMLSPLFTKKEWWMMVYSIHHECYFWLNSECESIFCLCVALTLTYLLTNYLILTNQWIIGQEVADRWGWNAYFMYSQNI